MMIKRREWPRFGHIDADATTNSAYSRCIASQVRRSHTLRPLKGLTMEPVLFVVLLIVSKSHLHLNG